MRAVFAPVRSTPVETKEIALKRAEYQRILATGTIDDLIAEIDSQTAGLR